MKKNMAIVAFAAALSIGTGTAFAGDGEGARIGEIEKMLQNLQRQREEQDSQIRELTAKLAEMQQQLAQPKPEKADGENKKTGNALNGGYKNGIVLEDGSGDWKTSLNGRIQADYRSFSPNQAVANTFSIRRARLGATVDILKDFSMKVEGEYSAASTTMTYGYIDYKRWNGAKLRIGQFKPFYGLERATSTNLTDFQERSMADAMLGSMYDRGVTIFGEPVKGLNYSLTYINGAGTADEGSATSTTNATPASTNNNGKDYSARLTGNIAEWASIKDSVIHVGGFYGQGGQATGELVNPVLTEGRGTKFFMASEAFNRPVDRKREGIEAAFSYGPLKLQSEYIRVSYDGIGVPNRGMSSRYADVTWMVTGESYADDYRDSAFWRIKPRNNFAFGGGLGALELGLRYSNFDASDFKTTNAVGTGKLAAGMANKANAWTAGVKWILNPNTRAILNYVNTRFDTPVTPIATARSDTSEKAVTARAQFDF